MIRFGIEQAAAITGGQWRSAAAARDGRFTGMVHDSRQLRPGNLFAAIRGARFDGHDFLADVQAAGAAAALVERAVDEVPLAQLVVDDVIRAMGALARAWREQCDVRLVGVTGSNGKTTVKTMLAAVLARAAPTLATRGNYNNEIGVPLTLAALSRRHRFAVVEMGCGQPGDIAYLAGIARPDVAVVTNAGPAHLERLGSLEGVARTKGELFQALGAGGVAVINRDDPFHDFWSARAGGERQIGFGCAGVAEVRLEVRGEAEWIVTPDGEFRLRLALPGAHNRLNALAATGAALALGIAPGTIAEGLAEVQAMPGRLYEHRGRAGWTLIDDSYNANPASVRAALEVLAAREGQRWLVLGDMGELGPRAAELHRDIGASARDLGIDRLFALGPLAAGAVAGFGGGAEHFATLEALLERLVELLAPDVTCLVKGSRSAGMDRVADRLMAVERAPC